MPKTEHGLNQRQVAFINEYLIDLNATQAAIRAGYSEKTAGQIGHELLKKPEITEALAESRKKLAERAEISQDLVLKRWLEIANANPNDLIQFRRVCCRNCFGVNHEHQWIDEAEYERAVRNASINDMPEPSDDGGYGFDPTIRPHPKCPKCHGEGYGEVHANDTRFLTGGALALYAGVKQTKEGFEIKMHDQAKALENIARHLGMFKVEVNHDIKPDSPLADLMTQLAGKVLKPVQDA